jgi:hypothetical protein
MGLVQCQCPLRSTEQKSMQKISNQTCYIKIFPVNTLIINKLHLSSLHIIGLIKFILDEKFFIDLKVGQILDAVDGLVFPPCMDQVSIKTPKPKCRLY